MNAPKKPNCPIEPKKPEKSYMISSRKEIDICDGAKFADILKQIFSLGISHDDLFFNIESTGSSYGDTYMRLTYNVPETITLEDADFNKLMKGYMVKMKTYKQKLAKYEFLIANYEKDYETWQRTAKEKQRQKDIKEFERLKKSLKL